MISDDDDDDGDYVEVRVPSKRTSVASNGSPRQPKRPRPSAPTKPRSTIEARAPKSHRSAIMIEFEDAFNGVLTAMEVFKDAVDSVAAEVM